MLKIITISAISGGGKTTIVNACSDHLNAEKLFFDDYFKKEHYPQDIKKWLERGADLNSWTCSPFTKALKSFKKKYINKHYLFVEEPTGRCRKEVRKLIDYSIVIDTPPEIALSRRIMRNIENIPHEKLADFPKEELVKGFSELIGSHKEYLRNYEISGRDMYINIQNQVLTEADLVVSWRLSVDEQVSEICQFLKDL